MFPVEKMKHDSKKVVVAMSGGVDSTVAAYSLKQRGFDVVGVFLRMSVERFKGEEPDDGPAEEAARRAASEVGVHFQVLDCSKEFEAVVSYFCNEYLQGRTPNPCVVCNRTVKFAGLIRLADRLGAAHVATGHYARVERRGERFCLLRGIGRGKDQSYVLFRLTQGQLARVLLPNGRVTKEQVRRTAAEVGLSARERPESQDVCFVPGNDYRKLLRRCRPGAAVPGQIVDVAGGIVGEHEGLQFYTVGQRRGLGIALGSPKYVVRLDAEKNALVIGDNVDLFERRCGVSGVNWVSMPPPEGPVQAEVQIRYTHVPARAVVRPDGDKAVVEFEEPQRAITPGQAAVFYDGDVLLGGGWIEQAGLTGDGGSG